MRIIAIGIENALDMPVQRAQHSNASGASLNKIGVQQKAAAGVEAGDGLYSGHDTQPVRHCRRNL
jgi:hypothetical protein